MKTYSFPGIICKSSLENSFRGDVPGTLRLFTLIVTSTITCQASTIAWNLTESEVEGLAPAFLAGTTIPGVMFHEATFASGSRGSGSGMFRDLMRLQASGKGGVQKGINRDSGGALDESFLGGNTNLKFSDLAEDRSGTHFVFNIDFNEGGGKSSLISLDKFDIYVSNSTDIAAPVRSSSDLEMALGLGTNSSAKQVFSMGSNVILADAGIVPGSGKSDLDIYIPKTLFGSRAPDDLVYIYSEMGGFQGDESWTAEAGKDSIATGDASLTGISNPFTVIIAIPEPSGPVLITIAGMILVVRRRR